MRRKSSEALDIPIHSQFEMARAAYPAVRVRPVIVWHDACDTPACRSGLPISLVALLVIEYYPLALRWTGRKELDPERANY